MPRVPEKVQDLVNFCADHATTWTPSPTSLGITAGDVAKLKTAIGEALVALAAQSTAKDAAKAATLTANAKVKALRTMVGTLVRTIVTFAEAAADPTAVFAAAQLSPTDPRTPSLPPGQPTDMTAALDGEGNITIRWKCVNPVGGNVVYSITRRDNGTGAFVQVGLVGKREFKDQSIPAGTESVAYQIRGLRGAMTGPASYSFNLMFGHAGGGNTQKLKMAA